MIRFHITVKIHISFHKIKNSVSSNTIGGKDAMVLKNI